MRRFLKRLAMIPLTMLIVSAVVFICLSCASGDSSAYILPEDASPEAAAAYRASMGLDEPLLLRYSDFLFSFIRNSIFNITTDQCTVVLIKRIEVDTHTWPLKKHLEI